MNKNSVSIRKATQQDLPYIYEICLKTGFIGKDATPLFNAPTMLGSYYAAPYIAFDADSCFVATLENIPCGYILCTKDSAVFYDWLEKSWLPTIRSFYNNDFKPKTINEEEMLKTINTTVVSENPLFTEYPAHLHIDLLPEIQGMGFGRKLFETLKEHLKSQNVKGFHLGVSGKNKNAIAFYEKMQLSVLQDAPWGFYMGTKL